MRTAIMVLISIVMAIMVLTGVYIATDSMFSSGQDEIEDSGSQFSNCIREVLTNQDSECGLFGDENGNTGG